MVNSVGTFGFPFSFTGEMVDANALVYLRARYYHPGLGVFTSLDPMEGVNRYQYVGGNVVNAVDSSGQIMEKIGDWDPCQQNRDRDCCCLDFWLIPLCKEGRVECPCQEEQQKDRVPLTTGLGSPANDVAPLIDPDYCSQIAGPNEKKACEFLVALQNRWPKSDSYPGPTYGELVALVIGTEWYSSKDFTGNSGTSCKNLYLGEVKELAMANQFWSWYTSPDKEPVDILIGFMSYFQPIREQQIGGGGFGTIFTDPRGVGSLIDLQGQYAEAPLLDYVKNIFAPNNPFALFTQDNPGSAAANCPYGFAQRVLPNVTEESYTYAQGGILAHFPASGLNSDVVSFAQNYNEQVWPTPCGSFEKLRREKGCEPQPLPGLP